MDKTTIAIIMLAFVNGVAALLSEYLRRQQRKGNKYPVAAPPPDAEKPESLEDALLKCLARMGATPRVLAALIDADRPLTVEEIHRRFPQEDANIPCQAINRTLRILMNGAFVTNTTRDLEGGRWRIRARGRELYQAIVTRGYRPDDDELKAHERDG